MINISVRDIGPIATATFNFGKFNIIYGETGSGKSFLMRLLCLLHISNLVSSCFEGNLSTIFSKLVLLDDNRPTSVLEMREDVVRTEASKTLLRSTSCENYGEISVKLSDNQDITRIEVSDKWLSCSLDKIYIHYVPQERSLPNLINRIGYNYVNIARSIVSNIEFSSKSSLDSCTYITEFYDIIIKQNLSPIIAFFIIEFILGLMLHIVKLTLEKGKYIYRVIIDPESDWSLMFDLLTGSLRFLNKKFEIETAISSLRTPQGALEYIVIELLHKYATHIPKVILNTYDEGTPVLFIVDEIGIHCDPMLKLRLVENLVKRSLESENLYTVVTTHDPDVLSKTLQILEKNRDKYSVDDVKIHVLKYDEGMRGYVGETIDLELVENVVVPSKSIDILEKVARELSE